MLQVIHMARAWKSLDAKENFALELRKSETLTPCPVWPSPLVITPKQYQRLQVFTLKVALRKYEDNPDKVDMKGWNLSLKDFK
jgi:hypothetical protein